MKEVERLIAKRRLTGGVTPFSRFFPSPIIKPPEEKRQNFLRRLEEVKVQCTLQKRKHSCALACSFCWWIYEILIF